MFESCQLFRKAQGVKSSSFAARSPLPCMEKKKTKKQTKKTPLERRLAQARICRSYRGEVLTSQVQPEQILPWDLLQSRSIRFKHMAVQ